MKIFISLFTLLLTICLHGQTQEMRWKLEEDNAISWTIEGTLLPHADNIEMSGRKVSGIISYAVDENHMLQVKRQIFYPQLHPLINESDRDWYIYRAYLNETYGDNILPRIYIGDRQFSPGKLKKVTIDGMIRFDHEPSKSGISLSRKLFPDTNLGLFYEELTLTNTTNKAVSLKAYAQMHASQVKGKDEVFVLVMASGVDINKGFKEKRIDLEPNASETIHVQMMGVLENERTGNALNKNGADAKTDRSSFLREMASNLILETPNPVLNRLFAFSKIRASESIFDSKLGPIHSPGGGRYYVGIWANDQAEYVSPFFPYLGYDLGNESAMSTYRAFDSVKSPDYKAIQYAFEIEGTVPPFSLDRGDAAMISYGASQYALARGDLAEAQELWPLIEWCLAYNHKMLNEEGVVKSASDEMEGRIPTGSANLSTSSLYYGALQNAQYLAKELGLPKSRINTYSSRATNLYEAIENYFGATVEGLATYKYYKEHSYLRHWICLPLVMDINTRREATVTALFNRLWTDNGVHVEKNSDDPKISKIFWDRGTLYALRGTFRAGATETSLKRLEQFSQERLLGERVPYVVEAYPEGNMAHLSAESGLYCRVFTEGLFGITPKSFNSFTLHPRLPKDWNEMALRHIRLFGKDFDIEIGRKGTKTTIRIIDNLSGKVLMNKSTKNTLPTEFAF